MRAARALFPGLVNLHTHLFQSAVKGLGRTWLSSSGCRRSRFRQRRRSALKRPISLRW
jgi:cytosine/adenosine deaminase-related metal-dependent hydrolase